MTKNRSWLVALFGVLISGLSFGQVSTGTPPFGSFGGGPFDTVNLGNLNVHFAIPVLHKTGRGMPFTYDLNYDSSIWTPGYSKGVKQWLPAYNWGWRGQTETATGYLSFSSSTVICYYTIPPHGIKEVGSTHISTTNYVYHDPWGASHPFAGTANLWTGNGDGGCTLGTSNGVTSTATDGSGYTLNATTVNLGTVYDKSGKVIGAPLNSGFGSASATDTNGNEITVNSSGQYFDTLSSTIPALTISTAAPPAATTFTYPAPADGASSCNPISQCVSVTMNYQTYTVQTAFGVSGINEYGPLSNPLISSVQLPDGSSYTFAYEGGPSSCTPLSGTVGCTTGRIKEITLPSGGTIKYTYPGGNNGIESDGSTAGLTRTLNPGGEWQYSRALQGSTAPGPGSAWTTTVIDPNNNTTTINFAEDATTSTPTYNLYETGRAVNQLISGTQTPLLTTVTCYNANYANCTSASTTVSSPITQTDFYRELPNGKTALSQIVYNSYGLVTDDKEYDYGVQTGVAPGNTKLIRDTTVNYYAPSNYIATMKQAVYIYDWSSGSAKTIGATTYTFDGAAVSTTSGTPQHISVSGARGNLTTIASQTSGSTTLYRQFTYWDTGMLNNSTDYSIASSTTCASSPSTCTTYNYSSTNNASCGNSFPTSISEPMSLSVSMSWNCTGGVLTQTKDPNGNPTNYTYGDANFWRVTGTSFPDGGSTSTTYNFGTNSPWNIQTSTAKDSSTSVTGEDVLDGFGRVVQTQSTSDPTNHTDYVDIVYDAINRLSSVSNTYQTTTDPTYGVTQYSYDSLNRITAVIHPDSSQATFTYTGAATQVVDEGNNSGSSHVQRVYQGDGMGRLISVCEVSAATQLGSSNTPVACGEDIGATGFLSTYSYSAVGNLTSATQGSLTRSYSYDYLSRLTQEVNPESGTTNYSYDTGIPGSVYQRTRPKPNQTGSATVITTYAYDKQHRLTGISYNDGSTPSVTLNYDQPSVSGVTLSNYLGRLTSATAAGGAASTIFTYDTMGRTLEDWQCTPLNCGSSSFSLTFSYDYLGDATSLANSSEGITYTYTYDTLARLTKLQSSANDSNHPGTLLTVNTYNPLGEVTKATLGNGIIRTVGYDNRGRITSLADGSIYSLTLGYAADSNLLTGNDSINGNWTYTYDDFNRVASANKNSGQQTYAYAYDRYSNRWQQNSSPSYLFNNNNQIQGSGVVYDAAGNITNDGLGNTYYYDAENRVISVSGNNSASYIYDAFGQRVRTTVNSVVYDFIYNNGAAVDEISGSNWVWGDAGASQLAVYGNSTTYFEHTDWVGSVRGWSGVSGNTAGTCTNLPYGDGQSCTGVSPNSWAYTGLPSDSESSLTHAQFRQLSTTEGRWMTSDPAGLGAVDPRNPQSWNRYAYVVNAPTNFVDPSGLKLPVCTSWMISQGKCPWSYSFMVGWGFTSIDFFGGEGWGYTMFEGGFGSYSAFGNGGNNKTFFFPPRNCTGTARVIGAGKLTNGPGGAFNVVVSPGTAAIIPSQFGMTKSQLLPYIGGISGMIGAYAFPGDPGPSAVFNGVSDVVGPPSSSTYIQAQNPGDLIIELEGGQDLGVQPIYLQVPAPVSCPTGTTQVPTGTMQSP